MSRYTTETPVRNVSAINGTKKVEEMPRSDLTLPDGTFRIALVCMPWASAKIPSIQIGLISAIAQQTGFETDSYYFNLDLAKQLTPDLYERLCEHRGNMTGEWMFARAAFGSATPDAKDNYFTDFPEEASWAKEVSKDPNYFIDLRNRVLPQFIADCMKAVDWTQYQVVGFSSTFQQNVACLALARLIKEAYPKITIVFGGANFEAEMGLEVIRSFAFIDFVISGEGDLVFPLLLRHLFEKQPPNLLPGLLTRDNDRTIKGSQVEPFRNLDELPIPDYRSYFDTVSELKLLQDFKDGWTLPFESSRGCWWGEKQHCTFCGLNGLGMSYRTKSADRVLAELAELSSVYNITSFGAVDNIVSYKYVDDLFPRIEAGKFDYRFFYEVKANLTRKHLHNLHRGGVRSIQPGIESMSSHVLKLMRKGSTMLQNVLCLKWSLYYGIGVSWNLIWGFPGETEEDYENEFSVLMSIQHLEPPNSSSRIWLERFSPYFTEQEAFGVKNIRPAKSYSYVYPSTVNLARIAYFFDYEMDNTVPANVHNKTINLVSQWRKSWYSTDRHTLVYRRTEDKLLIDFNWGNEKRGTYPLSGIHAYIYEFCNETMQTPETVRQALLKASFGEYSCEEIREALDEFCNARLMIQEQNRYLSLAIPTNPNW